MAADTLIRSIAVWRPAVLCRNASPMKLWITEVDSTGMPLTDRVVFEGPTISVPLGDCIHPIKIEYAFDPPIALPRRGVYWFAVQNMCQGFWDLLRAPGNAYPGYAWRTGRIEGGETCPLRVYPNRLLSDLVFTIVFCREAATGTRRHTWGQLKVIYR